MELLTRGYQMDRSGLQSKLCKEKESELIKGKCYENGQFGYTLLSTAKCLNILRLHWRHLILFGGYSPSVPGNLSGHWTGR
jgi:NADH:ubiquinone oxidoreductase subunit H